MEWTKKEQQLINILKKRKFVTPSHDFDHLEEVAAYGEKLARIYKAKREIVVAAALLHDLGRVKPHLHGRESTYESAKLAEPLLKQAGYNDQEIRLIKKIIEEHDQPKFSSKILESRILKDADFLDGFGARGLLRTIYYTAEAGEPLARAIERLTNKMKARYEGLEFPESRQLAHENYKLVQLVVSYLKNRKLEKRESLKGKLIIFEGISGTGKETQAKLLADYLKKKGYQTEIVYHPTSRMKEMLKFWRQSGGDSLNEFFLFIADRFDVVSRKILPALRKGKIVISLRGALSTLVYQAQTDFQTDLVNYLYSIFEPLPEAIFYFYLAPHLALARIEKRIKMRRGEKGRFEELKLLEEKQNRYLKLIKNYQNIFKIKAKKPIDEVHQDIINLLHYLW